MFLLVTCVVWWWQMAQILNVLLRPGPPSAVVFDLNVIVTDPLHDARRSTLTRFKQHDKHIARLGTDEEQTLQKLRKSLSRGAWLQASSLSRRASHMSFDGPLLCMQSVSTPAQALLYNTDHAETRTTETVDDHSSQTKNEDGKDEVQQAAPPACSELRSLCEFAQALVRTQEHCVLHALTLESLRTPLWVDESSTSGSAMDPLTLSGAVKAYLNSIPAASERASRGAKI